ncbi:hypothetical protein ABT026_05530 [Streptomyces sp. NPDC002734]|uniref:hypothetical protein n=1 Tax=Streptomyces sp. NPDC002734 TaxID=3154426 RepID=UPI003331C794
MDEVTVEGLAAQLDELADLVIVLSDKHDHRMEVLEQALTDLQDGVVGYVSRKVSGAGEKPPPEPWTARATLSQWSELADWVDWLRARYQPVGEYGIPPCWPCHPGAAEEHAALWAAWKEAMRAAEQPRDNGNHALLWHEQHLWGALFRAHRVIPEACLDTGHVPAAMPVPTERIWNLAAEEPPRPPRAEDDT